MPLIRIPGTDRILNVPAHIGDIVVDMRDIPEADSTIANEDVPIVGTWNDYTGSGTRNPGEVMIAGAQNVTNDLIVKNLGEKTADKERTDRGKTASTHRTRAKLVTLEVK